MGDKDVGFDPAAMLARLEQLEQEVATLTATSMQPSAAVPERSAAEPAERAVPAVGRRQVLRTGLAAAGAAVATGAVLLDAQPAAAADGSALVLGSAANTATSGTELSITGSGAVAVGLAVVDGNRNAHNGRPAIYASADSNFALGIQVDAYGGRDGMRITTVDGFGLDINAPGVSHGLAVTAQTTAIVATALNNGVAVDATAEAGTAVSAAAASGFAVEATSNTSTAVVATAPQDIAVHAITTTGRGMLITAAAGSGAEIYADNYQLHLVPGTGSFRQPPTTDTTAHSTGELVRDNNADLWLCVVQGTPGTWRKLGGPKTAGQFHVLDTPARVYDSRPFTTPDVGSKTPLAANVNRTVDLKANNSTVPADAIAVTVNLLLINLVAGTGNFTIWANGATKPLANTMVFQNTASANRASTLAITKVDTAALCQINSSLKTDIVVDVVGYYR